ncbi:MAG: hypothetical protein P8Y70_15385 [Candidatus Lokiarchaeota archaeon]
MAYKENSVDEFDGWLFDVSTYADGITLWVKKEETREVVQIQHNFSPEFFAVPKNNIGKDLQELKQILISHPNIQEVRICQKYVNLEDHIKSDLFGVSVTKPSLFKKTIQEIDKIDLFVLYNTDLPISQMYFYVNDLFPMSFCHFKVMRDHSYCMQLVSLELKDNNELLFYDLPPLKAIWLDVKVQQKGLKPYYNEPLEKF